MRRGTALALFALVTASILSCSDARNKVAGKGADGKNNNADDGDELGLSSRPQLAALGGDPHTFEVANDMFLLDGEPFRILAGEYHYQRTHPAHWRDRLRRLSAMGVNAIQTYTMWHLHEPFRPGSYDFSGPLDLEAFLDAAAAEGLWVLLRPGPYVCAEVDAGGLPWWLHDPSAGSGAGPQLRPRTADPAFLGFVDSWWGTLLPMMRPRMAVNGGNVLMVQMENEYGSFNTSCSTDKEGEYLRHLISTARTHLGDDVLFYTTDPPGVAQHGSLPGKEVLTLVDYGPGVDAAWAQSKADALNPPGSRAPLNSEFYSGWLTHWGELMANTSVPVMARSLEGILALPNRIVPFLVPQSAKAIAATTEAANLALIGAERGRAGSTGGVSLYMGAGGTNFGFQAGANLAGRAFEPALTSYDYDCPIGEDGHTGQRGIGGDGNKFEAIRAALLAAAEADAVAARARLEAAEAEAKSTAKHGRDGEVAAASASSSSSSSSSTSASPSSAQQQQQQQRQQQQRLKSLRKGAERAAADARFPDLPPPPPVVAFAAVRLSLVGDLLSDGVLGSLAGAGGGGVLVRFNSTTRGSASGWSSGGIGAVAVRGPALPAMEALGQASGLVLYRASVPRAAPLAAAASAAASPAPAASAPAASASAAFAPPHHASSVLDLGSTVHDYGGVYLDGVPVAALDRAAFSTSVSIPRLPALSLRSSSSGKGKKGAGGGNDGGGNVTLDILVHEMGRVNFGCVTLDHKGLETDAVTLDGEPVLDWRVIQLPLDDLSRLRKVKVAPADKGGEGRGAATATATAGRQRAAAAATAALPPSLKTSAHSGAAAPPAKPAAALAAAAAAAAGGMRAPSVYRGTLVVPAAAAKGKGKSGAGGDGGEVATAEATGSSRDSGGNPPSTWADLSGWGKGLLFVNGVNLGYYWPSKGPQTRQYVPGPLLKTGNNEIVLIELEAGGGQGTLSFASEPDFRGRVAPAAGTM